LGSTVLVCTIGTYTLTYGRIELGGEASQNEDM